MSESGQQTAGKAQFWGWPMDFSLSGASVPQARPHTGKHSGKRRPAAMGRRDDRQVCGKVPQTPHLPPLLGGSEQLRTHKPSRGSYQRPFSFRSPERRRAAHRRGFRPRPRTAAEQPRCRPLATLRLPRTGRCRGDPGGPPAARILGLPGTRCPGAEPRPGPGARPRGCRPRSPAGCRCPRRRTGPGRRLRHRRLPPPPARPGGERSGAGPAGPAALHLPAAAGLRTHSA